MDIKLINEVSWGGNPLAPVVHLALEQLGIKHSLELIETDHGEERFGIKKTPAMIINGKIALQGRIPPLSDIKKIIQDSSLGD